MKEVQKFVVAIPGEDIELKNGYVIVQSQVNG